MNANLLEYDAVRSIFKSRKTQFLLQLPAFIFLIAVVLAGFFGIQNGARNMATISVWVLWWPLLIISLALAGRLWCAACPFGAAADWVQRRTFTGVKSTFSLDRKFPARFRNLMPSTIFFLAITYADFQFNLANSPLFTAYFVAILLALIVVISLIFERRSFCRYVCPITGLTGLYSMLAPLELRAKDRGTCRACREKYCAYGNEQGYACPVFEYPGTMETNNHCILCTECVKTCHKDNIAFNVRPFAGDIHVTRKRMDESLFILMLLGVTIFQTFIMTRPWAGFAQDLMMFSGAGYDSVRFFMFIAAAVIPVLIYSAAISLLRRERNFTGYAYSLIPLVLMMHLSHNIRHLLEEGMWIIPALSHTFGRVSEYMPAPLFNNIILIQWLLMLTGLWASITMAGKKFQKESHLPFLIFASVFFALYLWMLGQPVMHRH